MIRLKIALSFLIVCLMACGEVCAKTFYDSKSWIVPVGGQTDNLMLCGLSTKVYPIHISGAESVFSVSYKPDKKWGEDLAARMTAEKYGNKIINALTAGGRNEDLLRKLAAINVQRQDMEFGNSTQRVESGDSVMNLLEEDYLPILTNCYYIVDIDVTSQTKSSKLPFSSNYYAIFRVKINNEEAFDIMSCIGDAARYDQLSFPMELCYIGKYKGVEKTAEVISKEVPGLALRGVITQRHPAKISIGSDMNIHKGDLVSVYSQRMTKKGEPYSKRISRARVSAVSPDNAQINFENKLAGNRKNGDVVVRTPDRHTRMGVKVNYTQGIWGADIFGDSKVGFTKSGLIHHLIYYGGASITDHPKYVFTVIDKESDAYLCSYKAPIFISGGLGYGISKTFLGFIDGMLSLKGEYQYAIMADDGNANTEDVMMGLSALRVPVSFRLSFNVAYPLRVFVEGGYIYRQGFGKNYKILEQSLKLMNARNDGLFFSVGVIF